jgi:hypothetical protein
MRHIRGLTVVALIALAALSIASLALGQGTSNPTTLDMAPGHDYRITCRTAFDETSYTAAPGEWVVTCAPDAAPEPTATGTPAPPTATAEPAATNTPEPTATATTPPTDTQLGAVNLCGEGTHDWHPPVVDGCNTTHEHGAAPPQWVLDSAFPVHFDHTANTPGENAIKHRFFKGYAERFTGIDIYLVFHGDFTPNGWQSRFHSYQFWARDATGAVSHMRGWADFGTGNNTGPQFVAGNDSCGMNDDVRPIIVVNTPGCETRYESWYASAGGSGGWSIDFGINSSPQYRFEGDEDILNPATWHQIGANGTRRLELAWYAFRSNLRGTFVTDQWGRVQNGMSDPDCGTSRTIGARTYTVVCMEQYIAPTLTTIEFPSNSQQRSYPMTSVTAPN